MQEYVTQKGILIKHYGSAKDLPAGRFKEYQKYLLEDWGVGTTMADVDTRLMSAFQFVTADSKEKALGELHNLRLAINYIINKLSIKSYAIAVLIHQIGQEVYYDYTEEGLKKIVNKIEAEMTQTEIETLLDSVKKKLRIN